MAEKKNKFIGDGKYVDDGGEELQKMWEIWKWKEISNCPGRYISKSQDAVFTQVSVILEKIDAQNLKIHECSPKLRDKCLVCIFPTGGGIITYIKEPNNKESEKRLVHTLNTQSGLQRKLEGLGLDYLLQQ
eukprot:c12557_g1_i1.p1 GENE.c12557_g1_i1~~c12557_g1_i1.p1  ORF type:complete len:131 (-),score=56.19 c12557_g1_i1:71-463(-)